MKKKIFTFFLALVASAGTAFAEYVYVGQVRYELRDGNPSYAFVVQRNNGEYSGNIVIPPSITYYGKNYSVISISHDAFYDCTGLTSVTIPNSVTSIGDYAFYGCTGLTSVHISDIAAWCKILFAKALSNPLFYAHNLYVNDELLTDLVIPNDVTKIKNYAFLNCTGLTSVTIPNSVTSIGEQAFYDCTGLTSVTIPNSVTSIGDGAFRGCKSLTSVTIEAETPPTLDNDAFDDTYCPIFVPCNAVNAYKSALGWEDYADRVYCLDDFPKITVRLDPSSCSGWSTVRLWAWTTNGNLFNSWPGQIVSTDDDGWYSYTFDEDITSVNIIWNNGTNQTVNIEGVYSSTCYALNSTSGNAIEVSVVDCPSTIHTQYTIVFKNWDGSVLQSTQVEEGKIPQYTGATPTKPSDSQYSYTFSGWTPQIVAATADATYTATFKSIGDHNITVRLDPSSCSGWSTVRLWAWTDEGNIFDSWPGQIVSKDSEGWYSYTFDEDITSVNIIWNNGTNQTIDIEGVTSSTCYALNSTSGKAITVSIVDCPLGHADETTTTGVTATPNEDNSVTLTWPAVNGVDTYTIEIKKNGVSVCTLVFNANGQLISINFAAPARDGKGRNIPAAEQSANGWTYIVTGLEENASYTYSVTSKDVNGNVLLKQSVDFSMGEEPTSIEDVLSDQVQCTKIIRDGQVFILRGDKVYSLTGQEVR